MATEESDKKSSDTTAKKPPEARTSRRKQKEKKGKRVPVKIGNPRWVAPAMVTLFIIGIVWIVAYYVAPDAPGISVLGWWNVLVGFGFLTGGFIIATKWK